MLHCPINLAFRIVGDALARREQGRWWWKHAFGNHSRRLVGQSVTHGTLSPVYTLAPARRFVSSGNIGARRPISLCIATLRACFARDRSKGSGASVSVTAI